MPELNDAQRAAVLHAKGPLLVFAGAGSGKTRVITYRIARLLSEDNVPPWRILAVTFTNKAAGEMKKRLEDLAGPVLANDLWVGTFHSISARLLRRYGDAVGLSSRFLIYDDSDQRALLARIMKELGIDEKQLTPKVVLSRIHKQKQNGTAPRDVEISASFDSTLVDLYDRYERALKAADAVDFDDLILHVLRIVEDRSSPAGEELRRRYDYVLVDEFQDTNNVQYRLVRGLAEHTRNLCVVGDDDQSIYSWRGADIKNIRDFSRDFPDATVVKLEQNYRSSGAIVKAANGVIAAAHQREPKRLWTAAEAGDRVQLIGIGSERDEAELVAETLKQRRAAGVPAHEMAVFYRINAQSRVLEEALRTHKIPYQIIGGMRFFERAEVKNLLAYLRLIDNPRSDADLVRIINVPTRGLGDKTVDRLLSVATGRDTSAYDAILACTDELSGAPKKRLLEFYTLIEDLRREAPGLFPSELAARVLSLSGYERTLKELDTAEGDARLENLAELIGSIKEYEQEAEAAGKAPSLQEYLERVALVADIDTATGDSNVLLMTIHSAKGLEFDTVLLTGMEEETFPYRGLESESNEEIEEERRLAYVAITRARRRLYITYASMRTIFGQTRYLAPSRFLADLPDDSYDHRTNASYGVRQSLQGGSSFTRPGQQRPGPYGAARGPVYGGRPAFGARPASAYGASPYGAAAARPSPYAASAGYGAARAAPPRPAPEEGARQIDYEAFDDTSSADAHDHAGHSDVDPSEGGEKPRLRRGMRVFHQRFGKGIVEEMEGDDKVVARFKGFGTKRVLSQYLRPSD
jgi:DNA helicase II / ATP-dependent DNA helicase PcrA